MNKLHEKSLCCGGKIYHFGKRRRQCSACKKTWSVWKKKLGRKKLRTNSTILKNYLDGESVQLYRQARNKKKEPATYSARVRKTLSAFIKDTPWPSVSTNAPIVLVVDAMLQSFDKKMWSIFLFLARPADSDRAVILPPFIREGSEHKHGGWKNALGSIPERIKSLTVALVSDGAPEAISQAKKLGWIIQRCHFHLFLRMSNYLRPPGPLARNIPLASKIYPSLYVILYEPNEEKAVASVEHLKQILPNIRSEGLKTTLSGFIKHYRDYRAYLYFPEYNLPTTSNSGEALVKQIRKLLSRAHGFRTITSFKKWTESLLKFKKTISCKGSKIQQN